jgi:hypothetical protein
MNGVLSLLQTCTGLYHLWERGGAGVLELAFVLSLGFRDLSIGGWMMIWVVYGCRLPFPLSLSLSSISRNAYLPILLLTVLLPFFLFSHLDPHWSGLAVR